MAQLAARIAQARYADAGVKGPQGRPQRLDAATVEPHVGIDHQNRAPRCQRSQASVETRRVSAVGVGRQQQHVRIGLRRQKRRVINRGVVDDHGPPGELAIEGRWQRGQAIHDDISVVAGDDNHRHIRHIRRIRLLRIRRPGSHGGQRRDRPLGGAGRLEIRGHRGPRTDGTSPASVAGC